MFRLQLLLLMVTVACALSVVTSQHKARKLVNELQQEKDRAQQMEVAWGQLQLEQGTWAAPARVSKIAASQLQMQLLKENQTRFVHLDNSATDGAPQP
jgi:cell division protein FtsL